MTDYEVLKITQSEDYKAYLSFLCRLASQYVVRIRKQYAVKAFEMYKNETVRKIVLAYGEELEDLEKHRQRDFRFISENPDWENAEVALEDFPINKAEAYGKAIALLFDIH